jgi:hypothetical protein
MLRISHILMRCAALPEYAQILEQVDINESLKSYNTASKILKEKVRYLTTAGRFPFET